jgi:hypothetical protein
MFIEENESIKEPAFLNIRFKTGQEKEDKKIKIEEEEDKEKNSIDKFLEHECMTAQVQTTENQDYISY